MILTNWVLTMLLAVEQMYKNYCFLSVAKLLRNKFSVTMSGGTNCLITCVIE